MLNFGPAIDLSQAVRSAIGRIEVGQPIEVYSVAKGLQSSFPNMKLMDIVREVSEEAVRNRDHSVVWHNLET
jgi:hypothetical protein